MTLVDDLTGEEGDVESVTFGLDGVSYEIDLAAANAEHLRLSLATFVANARRTGGRTRPRTRTTRASTAPSGPRATLTSVGKTPNASEGLGRAQARKIREWARGIGLEISDRGRIPQEVADRYFRDHKSKGSKSGVA